MQQPAIHCTVIGRGDAVIPQISRIKPLLIQLYPLQFEYLDQVIRERFRTKPDFNVKFNPDKESRAEFISAYCSRLQRHIEDSQFDNQGIQVEWLLNILK